MSFFKLIIKSLWYFRRQNLALFAGILISTAVLTGALIIGDSVKYSLQQLVDLRLGEVRYALQTGDRFVRAELADNLSKTDDVTTASLLVVPGIAKNPDIGATINSARVIGVDKNFWSLSNVEMPALQADEAILNVNVAEKLNLKAGDEFLLRLSETSVIPLSAPFAQDMQPSIGLRLTVKAIAQNNQLGRFSLKSNQATPNNIFINRDFLGQKLDLPGLANVVLSAADDEESISMNEAFRENWTIADAGLKIRELDEDGNFELISSRIFIDAPIAQSVFELDVKSESILTYLINGIRKGQKSTPYSFVTATNLPLIEDELDENEIIINQWLADDLKTGVGDTIELDYFVIGPLRKLNEKSNSFVVKEIIPIDVFPGAEMLMPEFPGLADAGSCRDWETGVPIDLDKIRDKDEKYWDEYHGTPKAYISLEAGQEIWANSFGNYTSFRFNRDGISPDELADKLLLKLIPTDLGLHFRPVYKEGLAATNNSVDFGELFLSLSFFVIVSGLLLTMLLFALNTESRSREAGILSALGFRNKMIGHFRMAESALVVILGGVAGAFAGIFYNDAIMAGLNSVWQDVVRTNMISVYVRPQTLSIGAFSGIILAGLVIYFITWRKLKQPAITAIKGLQTAVTLPKKSNHLLPMLIMIVGFLASLSLVIYSLISASNNPGAFMAAGGMFLIGSLAGIYLLLQRMDKKVNSSNLDKFILLIKNASRKKGRSVTTIALLALGVFTIMITGANQKTFYGAESNRSSGTGGFLFWAETSAPIIYDLNTAIGKEKFGLDSEKALEDVGFVQFQSLSGDDASCLNLNQVSRPQILGINPAKFDSLQSFSFAKLRDGTDNEHPWLELNKNYGGDVVPAFADQTVITWGLMKKVGDTLTYLNESGKEIKVLLIGGLSSSIFQGNLLIAEDIFRANFPSVSGSNIMLVDGGQASKDQVKEILQSQLTDYGIDITSTATRLAEFNSVTNTYLSVFMALGGLGVLIGTLGLGVLLLRSMLERRKELALLLALGFRKELVIQLIVSENLFLLVSGIVVGVLAALIGILPSLLSPAFEMNTPLIALILLIIFISGLTWIYFPARSALKKLPIDSLRAE